MKVAVVGNRTGWNYDRVRAVLKFQICMDDTIISGGAIGVDTFAQEFAKEMGCNILILYPNPDVPAPRRYEPKRKAYQLR